jgi:repressor LexA
MNEEMLINECSPTGFNIKESFKEYLIEKSKLVFEIIGDNMHPTLKKEDKVLSYLLKKEDWYDAEIRVYAVVLKEKIVVGRIKENTLLEKSMLILHHDNEKYPPITILAEDIRAMLLVDMIICRHIF